MMGDLALLFHLLYHLKAYLELIIIVLFIVHTKMRRARW
jgi:hypothetical protein